MMAVHQRANLRYAVMALYSQALASNAKVLVHKHVPRVLDTQALRVAINASGVNVQLQNIAVTEFKMVLKSAMANQARSNRTRHVHRTVQL